MILHEHEYKRIKTALAGVWAKSFWPLFALLLGILIGVLFATSDILNDCKYAGSFRVDSQAFSCQRKI